MWSPLKGVGISLLLTAASACCATSLYEAQSRQLLSTENVVVDSMSIGYSHSCVILFGGYVKCWGSNSHGKLGIGDQVNRGVSPGQMGFDLPVVNLGTGRTAVQISAAYQHTCALLDDGTVKCWGKNDRGQLGQGDTRYRGLYPYDMGDNLTRVDLGVGLKAAKIATGMDATCVILTTGQVKCWGFNQQAELGLGDRLTRGDGPNEMGDNLPFVLLGTGRTAKAITMGFWHTCVILDNDSMKCWGDNHYGQLGLGMSQYSYGDNVTHMGDNLPIVRLGSGRFPKSVVAGSSITCALMDDNTIKCWGFSYGALGLGGPQWIGDNANDMGDSLATISLGSGLTASQVATFGDHVCAIIQETQVLKCWGNNDEGQLGLGDVQTRGDNPGEMGDALPYVNIGTNGTVKAVFTGDSHTCAIVTLGDTSKVKCWGRNVEGQLGLGDQINRGVDLNQIGDLLPPVNLTMPAIIIVPNGKICSNIRNTALCKKKRIANKSVCVWRKAARICVMRAVSSGE